MEPAPESLQWHVMNGTASFIAGTIADGFIAMFVGLAGLFVLFFARIVLRSDWAAAAAVLVTVAPLIYIRGAGTGALDAAGVAVLLAVSALEVFVMLRIGLVAVTVARFTIFSIAAGPMILETSAWYATYGYASLAIVGAIAAYGFLTSLGGRPLMALQTLDG